MSIIRTENAVCLWRPENTFGVFAGVGNRRFGIHDVIQVPDPEFGWRPTWDVGHTSRSRRTILRGRISNRGSVPDILCQPVVAQRELFSMALGHSAAGGVTEGLTATDHRIPSFTVQVATRDTDGVSQLLRTYLGCKINRASWSAREGEELRFNIDEFLCQQAVHNRSGQAFYNSLAGVGMEAADPGPSATGRYIFSGAQITLQGGGLNGLVLARARRFNLSLDNQLETKYYLRRSDTDTFRQIPSDFVEGKRVYGVELEVDLGDPTTDLALWDFLVNQGGASGGQPTGCSITAVFNTELAEGTVQQLTIAIDSSVSTTAIGAVLKSAPFSVPAPPAGLITVPLSFDARSVGFLCPN
jgi:hypothetical protein